MNNGYYANGNYKWEWENIDEERWLRNIVSELNDIGAALRWLSVYPNEREIGREEGSRPDGILRRKSDDGD